MKRELAAAVAVALVASLWGAANAADPRNRPTAADIQAAAGDAQVVKGTQGGMPPTSQVMFANVKGSDGSLISSFPAAVTSLRLSTGTYDVRFTGRNISECAATITYGNPTSFGTNNGLAPTAVQRSGSSATGYFIQTFDGAGAVTDHDFMLHVAC